jgi:D-alanyl-D-alanine carboxypeptidase
MTKKWHVVSTIIQTVLLILALIILAILIGANIDSRKKNQTFEENTPQDSEIPMESSQVDDEEFIEAPQIDNSTPPVSIDSPKQGELPNIDLSSWMYRLVNAEHKLEDGFTVERASVPGGQSFDSRAAGALSDMYAAAQEQNLSIILNSGYRDMATQRQLYENRLSIQRSSGMSEEEAKRTTLQIVAFPGTSEHNLGLAIDILDQNYNISPVTAAFAETELGIWLKMNCADYGFILRYPQDKTDITGVSFEPWHFRYVGIDAAKYIMDNGLCLEEFLELYS